MKILVNTSVAFSKNMIATYNMFASDFKTENHAIIYSTQAKRLLNSHHFCPSIESIYTHIKNYKKDIIKSNYVN